MIERGFGLPHMRVRMHERILSLFHVDVFDVGCGLSRDVSNTSIHCENNRCNVYKFIMHLMHVLG